ncbi:MAG: chemotaxis protein CheB [Planctomycetota bacterium]|jgi:two-component system chemotaxis response regulator CheB
MKKQGGPIRVLVVDDSVVVRELLREILETDPDITVVGEATNGKEAVEKTLFFAPDLVTLDIRMPVMDGLEAVQEIMAVKPTPILVITASLSKDDLDVSFEAINRGALDVMLKPRLDSRREYKTIRDNLIDRIKILAGIHVISHPRRRPRKTRSIPKRSPRERDRVVVIGASLGGPAAVTKNFPAPILIVQHISPGFSEGFASWLDENLPFKVRLAQDGDGLKNGTVLIAPDRFHMVVEKGFVQLRDDPPMNSCKPSVDALFDSASRAFQARTVGIILTHGHRQNVTTP